MAATKYKKSQEVNTYIHTDHAYIVYILSVQKEYNESKSLGDNPDALLWLDLRVKMKITQPYHVWQLEVAELKRHE